MTWGDQPERSASFTVLVLAARRVLEMLALEAFSTMAIGWGPYNVWKKILTVSPARTRKEPKLFERFPSEDSILGALATKELNNQESCSRLNWPTGME